MRIHFWSRWAAMAWAGLSACLIPQCASGAPLVHTIAGTGDYGTRDAGAASSTFMMPNGIAVDPKGDLIVTDAAGQRIRIISPKGVVRTLAGSAALEKTRLGFAGGYVDGPTSVAKFNHPTGVAVDHRGNIFVADTLNHCIRKIDPAGVVSTYAGSRESGYIDAPRLDARFVRPLSLAVDHADNVYVADPGSGLREISSSGKVSTLSRGTSSSNIALAVAVYDGEAGTVVFVGERFGLLIIYPNGAKKRFPGGSATDFDTTQPLSTDAPSIIEAHRLLGFPTALTALNDHTVAFTDARTNTIRVLETIHRTLRIVGGPPIEDGSGDTGAFRDGPAHTSLFFAPLGIASDATGNLFVADGGSRRIREVVGVDYRYAVAPSRGLVDTAVVPANQNYRVAYLGNSAVWYNTDWENSIEGHIEKTLNADQVVSPKMVHVTGIAGNEKIQASSEYAQWLATVGAADLVILNLNVANIISSFGDSKTESLPPTNEWGPKLTAQLTVLRKQLATDHIPLIVVTFPPPFNVSLAESAYGEVISDLGQFHENGLVVEEALNNSIRDSGIPLIDLDQAFLQYEQRQNAGALFGSDDYHFSKNGRRFVGEAVSKALEKLSPWSVKP